MVREKNKGQRLHRKNTEQAGHGGNKTDITEPIEKVSEQKC